MPKKGDKTSKKHSVECEGITSANKTVKIKVVEARNIFKGIKMDGAMTNMDHAEMLVMESMSPAERNGCILTQNAYPCDQCHLVLRHLSKPEGGGAVITVNVQDDNKYWQDHTAGLAAATISEDTLPVRITYTGGHATYVAV